MDPIEKRFREGVINQRLEKYQQAIEAYRDVLVRAPGSIIAKNNLCLSLLASGEYFEGFQLYDVRSERTVGRVAKPTLSFPEWQGGPLTDRRVLIWPEQGFGDQIMFARFARYLTAQGATVSFLAPQPLVRLLRNLNNEVFEAGENSIIPNHDYWILSGSLPGRLGVRSIVGDPYLPTSLGGEGVGIVTHTRPFPPGRALPDTLAAHLIELTGGRSLEPEETGAMDFEDTRTIIAGLRLVITVDTAVAHLAGAMGKPTWLLLPKPADWRWGTERECTPWYSSIRLFRQHKQGEWGDVIDRLARAYEKNEGSATSASP